MKGRFIANGVLSAIALIGFIMFIACVISIANDVTTTTTYHNTIYGGYYSTDLSSRN